VGRLGILFATRTGKSLDLANTARAFKRTLRKMTPEDQGAGTPLPLRLAAHVRDTAPRRLRRQAPGAHHVRCRPDGARQSGDDLALLRPVDSRQGRRYVEGLL